MTAEDLWIPTYLLAAEPSGLLTAEEHRAAQLYADFNKGRQTRAKIAKMAAASQSIEWAAIPPSETESRTLEIVRANPRSTADDVVRLSKTASRSVVFLDLARLGGRGQIKIAGTRMFVACDT